MRGEREREGEERGNARCTVYSDKIDRHVRGFAIARDLITVRSTPY